MLIITTITTTNTTRISSSISSSCRYRYRQQQYQLLLVSTLTTTTLTQQRQQQQPRINNTITTKWLHHHYHYRYHGRIVVTPIPNFTLSLSLERKTIVEQQRLQLQQQKDDPTTTTQSKQQQQSLASSSLLSLLLLPNTVTIHRSTEKEIDPISIYGTSQMEYNKRYGPIYYTPQYHYDWYNNTINQQQQRSHPIEEEQLQQDDSSIITTNTTTNYATTSNDDNNFRIQHDPIEEEQKQNNYGHSHSNDDANNDNNNIVNSSIITTTTTTTNNSHQLIQQISSNSISTYMNVYLYRNQQQQQQLLSLSNDIGESDSNNNNSNNTNIIPLKNIVLNFHRKPYENVIDTLQRIAIRLVQHYTATTNSTKKKNNTTKTFNSCSTNDTTNYSNNNNNNNNTKDIPTVVPTASSSSSSSIIYPNSRNSKQQQRLSQRIFMNRKEQQQQMHQQQQSKVDTTITTTNNINNYNGNNMNDNNNSSSCDLEQHENYVQHHQEEQLLLRYEPSVWYNCTDPTTSVASSSSTTTTTKSSWKQLNVINYTNRDLYQMAFHTPISIHFTLQNNNNNDTEYDKVHNVDTAVIIPKEICLLYESFPPTIYSINVFDFWTGCIYVGIPITIVVETLYATHTSIDWYINGIYNQTTYGNCITTTNSNSNNIHTFTPLLSHINKKITLLITPYRKFATAVRDDDGKNHTVKEQEDDHMTQYANNEELDSIPKYWNHTGIGCEKAYRFQKLVQALPVNTILNLRKYWLMNTRSSKSQSQQYQIKNELLEQDSATVANPTLTTTTYNNFDGTNQRTIRVMTYNILADLNAYTVKNQVTNYPYVSKDIIDKSRRMPLIVHEIISYNADVICLQEVDYPIYDTILRPTLLQLGYQGYYTRKRGEGTNEGCAMFWSLHTFEYVPEQDQKAILLRDLISNKVDGDDQNSLSNTTHTYEAADWSSINEELWSIFIRRPDLHMILSTKLAHVAQSVPLVLRNVYCDSIDDTSHCRRPIWVTNTHLYYHPLASHIRLLQMILLLRHIDSLIKDKPGDLVVCGDLNSSRHSIAGKLIFERTVPENYSSSKKHLNTFRDPTLTPTDDAFLKLDDDFPSFTLPESFPKLQSAIDPLPEFTHYTHEFRGSLDHILFSVSDGNHTNANRIQLISSAPMPSIADVTVATAMPSPTIPSDHVSLVCDLLIND